MEKITNNQLRILIVDCNRFQLATIADSLRLQGVDVVAEARDSHSAEQLFRALEPEAILINYQGCNEPILESAHQMRLMNPDLGIVVLTQSPDLRLYGVTEGDFPSGTQLIEKSALIELRQLRAAIDSSLNSGVRTSWIANDWDRALSSLTDIQVETLRLLALGLSNSDIGRARFVSEKSVEQTIGRIAHHLQVTHEHGRNRRVMLAAEYFRWLGAPKNHIFASHP